MSGTCPPFCLTASKAEPERNEPLFLGHNPVETNQGLPSHANIDWGGAHDNSVFGNVSTSGGQSFTGNMNAVYTVTDAVPGAMQYDGGQFQSSISQSQMLIPSNRG